MRDQIDYYLDRARAAALAATLGTGTEVRPVIDALARTFGKIFRDRGLVILTDVPEKVFFRGERQDLEEMVGNLVDNACKWASATVRIKASLEEANERRTLRVTVEDDGPGLPEAARAQAVLRGRRLGETKPGSGLGLAIVSDLVGHYGGRLILTDSELGGTQAELELAGEARP